MSVTAYRLDTLAASLIERLEGARRTWVGQPEVAADGLRRMAEEHIDAALAERDELVGAPGQPDRTRRELVETFLPRYTRLALDQTDLEHRGYRAWRAGDPIARIVGGLAALFMAMLVARLVHHPVALAAFGAAFVVPFMPELRAFYYRRRYRAFLQEAVNDMGRIQDELDRYADPSAIDFDRDTAGVRVKEATRERRPQEDRQR